MRSPQPLTTLATKAHALGFSEAKVAGNARTTPEGVRLRWQWVQPRLTRFDLAFPFFIDWFDSAHPAQTQAAAPPQATLRLQRFAVGHPEAVELGQVLTELGTPLETYTAPALEFELRLETPRGIVTL
jgi:hypothetical protein